MDETILQWFQQIHNDALTKIFMIITKLGEAGIIWIIFGFLMLFALKEKKYGCMVLFSLLLCLIFVSIISYYFVVSSEIKLNEYSRQTIMLNDENADLQNQLDKLKSFSNVDMTMQKTNLLQKPDHVIEAPEVATTQAKPVQFETERPFSWSIGY